MPLTTPEEFHRISQMLAGLTVSVPIALMTASRIDEIEQRAASEPTPNIEHQIIHRLRALL
jgi:hypothetical protein